MHVCIYIYTKELYTVHPQTLCKHKLLFWMRLIAINRLTALIYLLSCVCVIENLIYNFILYHFHFIF